MSFDALHAPPRHSLGSVRFSTGALITGSILGGGYFSSVGSSYVVNGAGKYGQPKGTIFSGTFVGPITWTLVSHNGNTYVFDLFGSLNGTLYTGREITGTTSQTIDVNLGQWNRDQRGSVRRGGARFGSPLRTGSEPGTLGLFAVGLLVVARGFLPKGMLSNRAWSARW